ncbi:putative S-adenosylmethionine-dependent methyltransferase [uncultured archaeon]|nr:putative S-adenosylmethionine-dependent methyltransferase [uncultured archaeon]
MALHKTSLTLSFRGKKLSVPRSVYAPSDDSFLLAGAVKKFARGDVLDLGTGCGIQGIIAAGNAESVTFSDVSPEALECARKNAEKNVSGASCTLHFIETNLFKKIPRGKKFDVIIFNPPYLPTKPCEKVSGAINSAWDGGRNGRKVIAPFLKRFPARLKKGGILLYLNCHLSGTRETLKALKRQGFKVETVAGKRAGNERLSVFRSWK